MKMADRLENVHQPECPVLHLSVEGDRQGFGQALERQGIEFVLNKKEHFELVTSDGVLPAEVWGVAQQTRVQIRSIVPVQNSLDTIFHQVVGDDARAG